MYISYTTHISDLPKINGSTPKLGTIVFRSRNFNSVR